MEPNGILIEWKCKGRCHVVTEGLTLTAKKFMKFFQPLSSETVVSSVSPLLYRYATPHNATGHGREEGEIQSISFAKIHVYPHRFNIGGEVVK